MELERIIDNAIRHYNIDKERLMMLFKFRVPYFVGRLNSQFVDDPKKHVWFETTEEYKLLKSEYQKEGKRLSITPWNFEKAVDIDVSAEKFIHRMLSKCTYLENETVLPKNSLVYSEFAVLNELNSLKICNSPISVELKQEIFNKLFKCKNVKAGTLVDFLNSMKISEKKLVKGDISGIDIEGKGFNNNLQSYLEAKRIFGDKIEDENTKVLVENVLLWQSLFTDKSQIIRKIKNEYPNLSMDIVKKLKDMRFGGHGRLSKRFLTSKNIDVCGVKLSIMDLLWQTNQNLNEIIFNEEYEIQKWLDEENGKRELEFNYENDIATSYASPSVKRSVWQAMLVVDEIISLVGKKPDKIFIEVNRKEEKIKKRTNSRRNKIQDCYKKIKNFNKEYPKLRLELESVSDEKLRMDKLYLYFLQCGKCAYSGETINISNLSNDNLYDIDHIIPRALKKDDSLENRVLARKDLNNKKDMNYPLNKTPLIWTNKDKLIKMWESWKASGLISVEKFQKLCRTKPIDAKELEGFIARQLVFTGQSTTIVARLFRQKYEEAEVVYSKASNVSDFRKQFNILKCRDINDIHHADDAYLNIVVGNTYNQRFNHNKNFYIQKFEKTNEIEKAWTEKNMFKYSVDNAWDASSSVEDAFGDAKDKKWKNGKSIQTVRKVLSNKNVLISKMRIENKGAFYDQTICKADKRQKQLTNLDTNLTSTLIPLKGLSQNPLNNSAKYGGYKGIKPAYFLIIEHTDKKGERMREFISVSILEKATWEKMSEQQQIEKLSEKYKSPKIIVPKILLYTLFYIDKMECRLSGRNGTNIQMHNAKQWYADEETTEYVRIIAKYKDMVMRKKLDIEQFEQSEEIEISGGEKKYTVVQKLTKEKNLILFDTILKKLDLFYGSMGLYKGRNLGLPDIYEKVVDIRNDFINLSITRQIKQLSGLITGLGCNASAFDLSELGKGVSTSTIKPSVKISYPLVLVNESVTGIKQKLIRIYPFNQ